MSLESTVRECGTGIGSSRATERKKYGDNLKKFLMGNAVPPLLSENTTQNKGYTWNDLFDDINELVMKETEKYENSKTYNTVTGPLCANLLQLCISGSIRGKAYIRCDKVTEACIFILRDKRLTKAIGDAYLNLLYKHVLLCDHYLNNITPAAWGDLLDTCLSVSMSKNSEMDDYMKLRLLMLVIKNASNCCQFIIPLRGSLTKLKQCFLSIANDKKVQEVIIEVIISLLQTLSTECRLTMCEFTEGLLSSLLKFYDQNMDQKRKSSLFKLFRMVMILHHPLGRTQQESGSLASDWETWNKYLHSILEIACLEVVYLQKQRKQSENLLKHNNEFYCLSATVYYQIFNMSLKRDHDEAESTSKRQRVTYNRNNSFCDIVEEMRQNHTPWLSIIQVYLKNYGTSVLTKDYTTLLSVVEGIITNNDNLEWNILEEIVCLIVKNLDSRAASKNEVAGILTSLWNSCVRTSTLVNTCHKPMHYIIQLLLTLDFLKYQEVQPLVKLYYEKGMPVTDHSMNTLNHVFHIFFSTFNNSGARIKCFDWLAQGQITSIDVNNVRSFLLRLLSCENIEIHAPEKKSECRNLHDVLFKSLEISLLFSEFEQDILSESKTHNEQNVRTFELNTELNKEIKEYLQSTFTEKLRLLNNKEVALLDFMKFVRLVLCYMDITLKNNQVDRTDIEKEPLYQLLKIGVQDMYWTLTIILKNNTDIRDKINLLQCLKSILIYNYNNLLSSEVRRAQTEFFESVNIIINKKITTEDCVIYHEDESELDPQALRHTCIGVLASYCRKRAACRTEILDFILDPKIYNFSISWDISCSLECLETLNGSEVENPPLESIFILMQEMCKELFKNSEATYKILRVFLKMMDQIWNLEKEKQNCYIMVKGYLKRCEKKYYPPEVAALIYECVAKMAALSLKQNNEVDSTFMEALQSKLKGEIHSIRLYCSYLLKLTCGYVSDRDITTFFEDLMEIFVINIAERKESTLKDESVNRTVTVLHTALALVQTKNVLLQDVVTVLLQIQTEKSLDKEMTKKVLNKITNSVAKKDVETYFNDNVLFVLNFWFSKDNDLDSMPIYLFGFENIESFLGEHYKWAIAADILWRAGGIVTNSTIFNLVQTKSGKPAESIIEACICNIIALYIPYIVTNKKDLNYRFPGKREWSLNAQKVFESTTAVLGAARWSGLYVDKLSELVVLVASHFIDHVAAAQHYNVNIPIQTKSYHYPKSVFEAILIEIGEVYEENILNFVCENQVLTIFKALFQLWANVIEEKVFEYKVLYLHSFVTFLGMIPLDCPSDAFVANYGCTSLTHAIKKSRSKDEIRVFTIAVKTVLENYFPERAEIVRKSVLQLLPILMIKNDEGFEKECVPLLNYLASDLKEYLKENENVIDFISSLSQGTPEILSCSSKTEFLDKLKTYKNSLSCPSHETLSNMRDFLKLNKHYSNKLCEDLNTKGFSDDCGTSLIHQIVYSLSNTMKSTTDDKTIIEACNCLAEIGSYDLKTLVTIPPANSQRIMTIPPKSYFAMVVMTSLSEILFDENPVVTNAVSKTLKRLFQYREGKMALDLEEVNKDILVPLSTCNTSSLTNKLWADFQINDDKFKALLCFRSFWVPKAEEKHCQWLKTVTSALMEVLASSANYLNTLQDVCNLKPNLCQKILSPLLGLLLECSSESHVKALAETINQFFKQMWTLNQDDRVENSGDSQSRKVISILDQDRKMIIQDMLNIVNFIRLQKMHYKARPDRAVESLNYLRLDYEKVAWLATVADQNVAAIYYGELWAMAQNNGVPPASPEATTQLEGGENVQRIFRKCFVAIGEMDAIDGCGTAHLTSEKEKRKHLINTGQFSDALLLLDIALSCGGQADPQLQHGVVKSLHKSGMHHLALQYIKSLPENDDLNDIKYECLSFLGDWTDFVDTRDLEEKSKKTNCNPYSIIKAFRYSCLKDSLNIQPSLGFETKLTMPLNRAKRAVAKLCQSLNMENCQNVYKVLSKLHQFCDIGDYFSVRSKKMTIQSLLNRWQVEDMPAFSDFKHLEALITQRSLVLEHAAKEYSTFLKDIVRLQLKYAELSLSNKRIQMAQRLLAGVKKAHSSPEVALAESQISWAKGHKDIALSLLRNIVANPPPDVSLTAVSLRQYGIWMAESKRDNARDLINKYLKKSLEVLSSSHHDETRLKVYFDIATFADAEYKLVVAYMNSSVYEKKVKCVENMKSTVNTWKPTQQSLSKEEKKALQTNDRFGNLEEAEITNTKAEKETFLHLAMRYYLLSLKQSEANNLSVFRVISLWLDNPSVRLPVGEGDFETLLHAIPSCKFISVLPQLAPRLTNEKSLFADNLRELLKRCALEHPHHTLPILFNLKNTDKDSMILNASENLARLPQRRSLEPRVSAAAALVATLANENKYMAKIIAQMEMMCDATISLANYVPKSKQPNQKLKIPAAENIHKLGPLDAIPIPTVSVPVSVECNYSDLPTIHSFENYFETVGGINCPKKINCKSSDGSSRIVLIKGEDDLRQDAVMQQVFNIVNTLLGNDPVTSRNKLLIRTYKVVPMSKKSGVLEWCEGTTPIGAWLTAAHPRYRSKDISPSAARQIMTENAAKTPKEKLAHFLRILKDFRPVFHYFFTEHYLDPVTWYERRLAYTKSVASSSMIGYILGLGDRHVQNILIDTKTAEVVHIDFGIAFDQGRTLPTPETIPFRLTQDIVAGFGFSGVEGIFRRSCEKTMQLLRDNQDTLFTILEVLLCDPLYSWTITSKQQNVSTSKDTSINQSSGPEGSLAKRALLSVSSKLSGTEGGVAGGVAVPGQVARLLHLATDPTNLSRLFHGWQPYL